MRVSIDELLKGSQEENCKPVETNPILDDWLEDIRSVYDGEEEMKKHMDLVNKVIELTGGKQEDYVRMYDRELQDILRNGKKEKEE